MIKWFYEKAPYNFGHGNTMRKPPPLMIIILLGFVLYFNNLFPFNKKYQAYKCNYIAANFGTDEETLKILKEFKGDPCMKEGNNRFKTYWEEKYEKLLVCKLMLKQKKYDSNTYIVGCDIKNPWWKFW